MKYTDPKHNRCLVMRPLFHFPYFHCKATEQWHVPILCLIRRVGEIFFCPKAKCCCFLHFPVKPCQNENACALTPLPSNTHGMPYTHDVIARDILCHDSESTWVIPSEASKIHLFQHGDLDLWPMTYRYYQSTYVHQILGPYFKPFSRESADRHTHTHRRDRFHTLDR